MGKIDGDFVIESHERMDKVIDVGWPNVGLRAVLSAGDIRYVELTWIDNVGNFVLTRVPRKVRLPIDLDELTMAAEGIKRLIAEIREYQDTIDFGPSGPPGGKEGK